MVCSHGLGTSGRNHSVAICEPWVLEILISSSWALLLLRVPGPQTSLCLQWELRIAILGENHHYLYPSCPIFLAVSKASALRAVGGHWLELAQWWSMARGAGAACHALRTPARGANAMLTGSQQQMILPIWQGCEQGQALLRGSCHRGYLNYLRIFFYFIFTFFLKP